MNKVETVLDIITDIVIIPYSMIDELKDGLDNSDDVDQIIDTIDIIIGHLMTIHDYEEICSKIKETLKETK